MNKSLVFQHRNCLQPAKPSFSFGTAIPLLSYLVLFPVNYNMSGGFMAGVELRYKNDGTLIVPYIRKFELLENEGTPQEAFPLWLQPGTAQQFPRFIHNSNRRCLLIYTDGAYLNNGQSNPAAGWGFVFRLPEPDFPQIGRISGRLEDRGPSGESYPQTNNRAELRAVIAALQFRAWFGEGFTKLVIATDSEYVTKGATEWVRNWGKNGWMTSNGKPVQNRDLWEKLLSVVIVYEDNGMEICFWHIVRALNREADSAAKEGARQERVRDFSTLSGVLI